MPTAPQPPSRAHRLPFDLHALAVFLAASETGSMAAAVAERLGWAITTPLCLMEAAVPLDEMQIAPLPAPGLRRRLILIARRGELGSLPEQIAKRAWSVLRRRCEEFVRQWCPAVDGQVVIGQPRR